jgi:hypothetical protein
VGDHAGILGAVVFAKCKIFTSNAFFARCDQRDSNSFNVGRRCMNVGFQAIKSIVSKAEGLPIGPFYGWRYQDYSIRGGGGVKMGEWENGSWG